MARVYKICVLDHEESKDNIFVLIEPRTLSFESFKEALFNRLPMLKDRPLYMFYNDSDMDRVIINTPSDFEFFQRVWKKSNKKDVEPWCTKIGIVMKPKQMVWLNTMLNDANEPLQETIQKHLKMVDEMTNASERCSLIMPSDLESETYEVEEDDESVALEEIKDEAYEEAITLEKPFQFLEEISRIISTHIASNPMFAQLIKNIMETKRQSK